MTLNIRPAVEDDILALVSIDLIANANHPMVALPWPTPDARHSYFLDRVKFMLRTPLHYTVVATDAEGEIVGYISWRVSRDTTKWKPDLPEGTNKKVLAAWEPAVEAQVRFGIADSSEVVSLTVSPSYQKRGVGTSLLTACIEQLDSSHDNCGVFSSVLGRRLYENFGFRVLGETRTDFREFGGKEHINYILRRDAMK